MRTTTSAARNVRPQRRGGVLVLVAISMVALVGVLALAFDFGYFYYTTLQLQNAADSAAMAGAGKLGTSQSAARTAAITFAAHNDAAGTSVLVTDNPENSSQGDVVLGLFDKVTHTFTPTTTSPNAVKVVARRTEGSAGGPVSTFFGQIFGIDSVQMQRSAIAIAEGGVTGSAILLLAPSGTGLQHSGNGDVTVLGTIQINSTYSKALEQSGNGTIYADSYNVVGGIYDSTPTKGLPGEWNTGADPLPDPYADLLVPKPADYVLRASSKISGNAPAGGRTFQPGRYRGGFDLGDGTWNFSPGIYLIEGGGFKISSSKAIVNATEVMIYNAGNNINSTTGELGTSNADQILISGDSIVKWSPPLDGPYNGYCIFQHRQLSDKKIQISGNGLTSITGVVYGASAEVQLSGNGGAILGGGFVAKQMQISGDGKFTVGGAIPGGGGYQKVYLVW